MSTGDRYCNSCFTQRKNNASHTYDEDYGNKYWGVYCIPIVGVFAAIGKYYKYPGGIRYHVYVDGHHERWSKHQRGQDDLQKCSKCSRFASTYYELESWE